jgi:hypothetical protein
VCRALEKHVLEEMRKSGSAGSLICRADVVPQIHCHDWRRVIFRQRYVQTVVEVEGFYRNPHSRKLPAIQRHWNPLCAHT